MDQYHSTEDAKPPVYTLDAGGGAMDGRTPREHGRSKVFPYFPTTTRVNQWIKSSASLAGIKKSLSFHCARHTFGMYLANKGVSLVTIKELMGHSDIKTTQIYSRASEETKAQTIQEMDELDK